MMPRIMLLTVMVLVGASISPTLLTGAEASKEPKSAVARPVRLPPDGGPIEGTRRPFRIGAEGRTAEIWGRGTKPERTYFDEFLPALFERTLALDQLDLLDGRLEWIFTGPHGGFTLCDESESHRGVIQC